MGRGYREMQSELWNEKLFIIYTLFKPVLSFPSIFHRCQLFTASKWRSIRACFHHRHCVRSYVDSHADSIYSKLHEENYAWSQNHSCKYSIRLSIPPFEMKFIRKFIRERNLWAGEEAISSISPDYGLFKPASKSSSTEHELCKSSRFLFPPTPYSLIHNFHVKSCNLKKALNLCFPCCFLHVTSQQVYGVWKFKSKLEQIWNISIKYKTDGQSI